MFCFGFRSANELFARARAARPAAREAPVAEAPVCEAAGSSPAAAEVYAHYADDVCEPPPGFVPPLPVEQQAVARAHELIAEIQLALLPAYHRAVGAGDAAAALELAMTIERGVRHCARLDADPGVHVALALVRARLGVELGPQVLGGAPVRGKVITPKGKDPDTIASEEAAQTVALLATAAEIERDVGFDGERCGAASEAGLAAAAAKLEAWRGRPADFHFLVATLSRKGVWGVVSGARAASGRSVEELVARVDAQAAATGELVDVGGYDDDDAAAALKTEVKDVGFLGPIALPPSEEKAQKVFAMIASASPEGRVAIVKRLAATGRLKSMTDHLPLEVVRELMPVLDWDARLALSQALEGRGEAETTTEILEQAEQEEDEAARRSNDACNEGELLSCFGTAAHAMDAAGFFAMRQIYHLGTFGFSAHHDESLAALRRGEISPDAFASDVTRAALTSGATLALTALTAGTAGSFVTEALEEMGAGRTLAEIIGSGAGGGAAGVTDRAVRDVAHGELSDADAYLDAAGEGAVGGLLFGSLGAAARSYLPPRQPGLALAGAEGGVLAEEGELELGQSLSQAQREIAAGKQVALARTKPGSEESLKLEELSPENRQRILEAFDRRQHAIAQRDQIASEYRGRRMTKALQAELDERLKPIRSEINEHSRQMGEIAAEDLMEKRGGKRLYPTDKTHSTKGDFDQVWEVDGELVLVEAKGGGSELGTSEIEGGMRAEQGSPEYALHIARKMKVNGATAEIRKLGRRIEVELMQKKGNVSYRLVKAPIGTRQGAAVPRDIETSEFDLRKRP